MAAGECKHCGGEFSNVGSHQAQCGERLPWVYRRAMPFARRRIKQLGFDQRTHEGRIFRYAVLRYYVDVLELLFALAVVVGRIYLWAPGYVPVDDAWPLAGTVKLTGWDVLVFGWSILAVCSRVSLIRDYHRHVVTRLDKVAARS